jgi:transcription initiation factor TFIID subunit 5
MWDIQTGKCVRIFSGHFGSVRALAVSPDGRMLASAGADSVINLWDLAQGTKIASLHGHTVGQRVCSLDFSQGSSVLASGGADDTVRLWDVSKGGWSSTARSTKETVGTKVKVGSTCCLLL